MMEATKVTERPMEAHIPQEIICATKIVIATLPLYMLAWATTGVVVATLVVWHRELYEYVVHMSVCVLASRLAGRALQHT